MSQRSGKLLTKSFAASVLVNISLFILCYSLLSNFAHNKKPLDVVLLVNEPKSLYLAKNTHKRVPPKTLPVAAKNNASLDKHIKNNPIVHKVAPLCKKQSNPTQSLNPTNHVQITQKVDNNQSISKSSSTQFYEPNLKQNTSVDDNATQSISKEDYAFLRILIEKNLNYPYPAIRNGYQGTVVVSFVIHKKAFKDIVVTKSSGYAILDKAALEAVKKIEHYADIGEHINIGKNVKIVLPINFTLNAQ